MRLKLLLPMHYLIHLMTDHQFLCRYFVLLHDTSFVSMFHFLSGYSFSSLSTIAIAAPYDGAWRLYGDSSFSCPSYVIRITSLAICVYSSSTDSIIVHADWDVNPMDRRWQWLGWVLSEQQQQCSWSEQLQTCTYKLKRIMARKYNDLIYARNADYFERD